MVICGVLCAKVVHAASCEGLMQLNFHITFTHTPI